MNCNFSSSKNLRTAYQTGLSWADGLRDLYEILLFFELADLNFTDQPFPTQPIAYMKINKLERERLSISNGETKD